MSEANQLKKPNEKTESFENRNYNRRLGSETDSKKPTYPDQSAKFKKAAVQESEFAAVPNTTSPRTSVQSAQESKAEIVRLSQRDYEMFEFILDMKFASRDALFEKFFSRTRNLEPAKNSHWCQDRLQLLSRAGYLKPDLSINLPGQRFYIATDKAHQAVHNKIQFEKVPKPRKYIDSTVFVHDRLVAVSRLEFEKENPGCRWTSDLRLRAGMAALYNLPSVYIPDAIYELSSGERVAFEFENARKGRGAYREKITYFAKLIEAKRDDPNMFTRVRYRCVRPDVYNVLVEETSLYPGLFSVELWESPPGIDAGGKNPLPKYLQPKTENVGTEAEG